MQSKIKALETLQNRNIKDANNFHKEGNARMEEICRARADAYKVAIEIIKEVNI